MKGGLPSRQCLSCLLIALLLNGCIALPKTVSEVEDQACVLVTKSLTIEYYTSSEMVDEAVDEMVNALSSDCHEPECLLLFAPLIAISAGSFIVSGSIVVTGNTIHWLEEQGRCNESKTRLALSNLKASVFALGGTVITTGKDLILWFREYATRSKESDELDQEDE